MNAKTPTMKQTKPRPQTRKRTLALWKTRSARFAALAAVLSGVLGAASWAWHDGVFARTGADVYDAFIDVSIERGLVVREVLVSGRHETSRAKLLNAVGLVRGAPILDYDVAQARTRIEKLSWVRTASVRRVLPDTVVVEVVERRPLALWQKDGVFKLIDHDGAVIADKNVGRFADLLVVVGDGAPLQTASLMEVLDSQPILKERVKAAVWVGDRRWNVRFDNGIDVRMPEGDTAGAWMRLAEYERTHRVLARDVRVLDMRLPDRLIVRRPEENKQPKPAKAGRQT